MPLVLDGTNGITSSPLSLSSNVNITSTGSLQFNSGYGSVATAYGCRAWVNFLGTATPITITGSGNVSSITDSGVGIYVVNLSTAMPDTAFAPVVSGTNSTSEANDNYNVSVVNSSSYQIRCLEAGTLRDKAVFSAIFR